MVVTLCALLAAVLWRRPPYFDETFYAYQGYLVHKFAAYRFIALLDGKGPMLNWLTAAVINLHVDSLTAVRLVAAAADVATLIAIGALTRFVAGRAAAIVAMAMFVVSPFQLIQAGMGTYEPLVLAATAWLLYLQIRMVKNPRPLLSVVLGGAMGFALLTKANGTLAVILLPVSLLLFDWHGLDRVRRLAHWIVFTANALLIGALLYSVERQSVFHRIPHVAQDRQQFHPPAYALRHAASILSTNWPFFRIELRDYLSIPFLLLAAVGFGLLLSERPALAFLLGAWFSLPAVASALIATKPLSRFLLPWMAPVFVLAGFGAVRLASLLRPRLRSGAATTAVGAMCVALALPALIFASRWMVDPAYTALPGFDDYEFVADWPAGTGFDVIVAALKTRVHRGDVIAVTPDTAHSHALPVLLHDPGGERYQVLRADDPNARLASYLLDYGIPDPPCPSAEQRFTRCSFVDISRFKLLAVIHRPRNGETFELYGR